MKRYAYKTNFLTVCYCKFEVDCFVGNTKPQGATDVISMVSSQNKLLYNNWIRNTYKYKVIHFIRKKVCICAKYDAYHKKDMRHHYIWMKDNILLSNKANQQESNKIKLFINLKKNIPKHDSTVPLCRHMAGTCLQEASSVSGNMNETLIVSYLY